jgi:AcrR family transcriptional regulator
VSAGDARADLGPQRGESDAEDDGPRRHPGRPRDEAVTRAIHEVARRQLREVGFGRMTLEGIAAEAGVARATIYRRYRDLADLVTAAIAAAVELPDPAARSTDPRRDLIAFLEQLDACVGEEAIEVMGSLLASRAASDAIERHRRRVVGPKTAYVRGLMAEAQARRELAADLDTELAIQMLVGSVFARRISGSTVAPGWAERAVAMIWRP